MPFLGNLINTAAVLIGGIIGLFIKKGVSQKMQESLMQALGLCTLFIGISGTLQNLFDSNHGFTSESILVLIGAMVVGTFFGQLINIEGRLEKAGDWIKAKIAKKEDNSHFTEGFVTCSLIICVGAMAIVGGITDGMGKPETLIAKSVLDFVVVLITASTMGVGALCAALVMFLYQGIFGLIGFAAGNVMDAEMIRLMSIVGNVMICGVGINLLFGKVLGEHKLRVGNMLPALVVPVIYILIKNLF